MPSIENNDFYAEVSFLSFLFPLGEIGSIDLKQAKILLIGTAINQHTLSFLLQSWNAKVEIASDGLMALEKIYFNQYDLIFMNLEMDIMDGWATAKFIRQRLNLQMPLIALTNIIQQIDSETLTKAGFNGHLSQPIYTSSLFQLLHTLQIEALFTKQSNNKQKISCIDIDFIKKIANNDLSFVRDIIHLFEEHTSEVIQQLPLLHTNHQAKGLNALVHKYKSSANNVGNKKLYQLCNQMEKETQKNEPQWHEIEQQCNSLLPECQKILSEIPFVLQKLEAA